jgi:hypothetical protein
VRPKSRFKKIQKLIQLSEAGSAALKDVQRIMSEARGEDMSYGAVVSAVMIEKAKEGKK